MGRWGYRAKVHCRNCGGAGHNIRGCPSLSTFSRERYKTGSRARTCSYCKTTGHNKATCILRKGHMAQYVIDNGKYRADILARMVKEGIGVGALVKRGEDKDNDTRDSYSVIKEIRWELIHLKKSFERVIIADQLIDENNDSWVCSLSLNKDFYASCHVISGVPEYVVLASVPPDWLKAKDGVDKFF